MLSAARGACMALAVLRKVVTRFVCPAGKNVHMCCSVLEMCETLRVYAYGRPSGSCACMRLCEARSSFRLPPHGAGWHDVTGKKLDGHSFQRSVEPSPILYPAAPL